MFQEERYMAAHMPEQQSLWEIEAVRSRLKGLALFAGLTNNELAAVARLGRKVSYATGENIFAEGSEGTELYVLLQGSVDLMVDVPAEDPPEVISQLQDCDVFGELALLDGHPRSATARAANQVSALIIRRDDLFALMDDNPRLGYTVMRNLAHLISHRLREMDHMYSELMAEWWSLYIYAPSLPES
jgi:CRP/FNR family cyclic AMP-dependent transcriptional regulator